VFAGDKKLGLRVMDGDGVLLVANRLCLYDDRGRQMDVTRGWYVEEVAGIPVRCCTDFREALTSVDRAGGQEFEILFSQGEGPVDGITTVRDFRKLCDESPYESGRKRRPGTEDARVSASMFTETMKGEAPGGPAGDASERAVSLL